MNYKQILKLIDTLISKTKCRELEWSTLINSYNLFKAPQTSFLESTPFLEDVSMPVTGSSYYTERTGLILHQNMQVRFQILLLKKKL